MADSPCQSGQALASDFAMRETKPDGTCQSLQQGVKVAPYRPRPSFDFGTSFEASFLAEQCSAATSQGTCPLPEDIFPDVKDSDSVAGFDQPEGALSASTGSEAFAMHSLSTSGSSSDDLDELLTWLEKDVPLLGLRPSDAGLSPARFPFPASGQQEVTSPVARPRQTAPLPKARFVEPRPKAAPLLRIRIKSRAWSRPLIVVTHASGVAFKRPNRAEFPGPQFPAARWIEQRTVCEKGQSTDGPGGLQSCEGARSRTASDALPGSGGFGRSKSAAIDETFEGFVGAAVNKKKRAGNRHKRKDPWTETRLLEATLTDPVIRNFTSQGGSSLEDVPELMSGSDWGVRWENGAAEAEVAGDGDAFLDDSAPDFVNNTSKRPGLRVVRRRVHVAADEVAADDVDDQEEGAESPGRQATWMRKAPRATQGVRRKANVALVLGPQLMTAVDLAPTVPMVITN